MSDLGKLYQPDSIIDKIKAKTMWQFGMDIKDLSDRNVGLIALERFWMTSKDKYGSKFKPTEQEFMKFYDNMRGNQIGGLGLGIKFLDFDSIDIKDAMERAVDQSEGRVPSNLNVFRQALSHESGQIDLTKMIFWDEVVAPSVTNLATDTMRIKETLLSSAENINKYMPWFIGIAALGLTGYVMSQGKSIGKLFKKGKK